jgi:hypothetical protein
MLFGSPPIQVLLVKAALATSKQKIVEMNREVERSPSCANIVVIPKDN